MLRSHAHPLGASASARGIKLLVITTQEIAALTCSADLVELINVATFERLQAAAPAYLASS